MQEEMTIEGLAGALDGNTTPGADATSTNATPRTRRGLRARWRSMDGESRAGILSFVLAVSIVGTLVGAVYGALAVWHHNGRTQAVQRAMKMDGETYTITNVDFNFIGDTRLYLTNERGEGCGWVMIHMNNPFTGVINPLFLTFAGKGREPMPLPMKVRVHYRPEAWADENVSSRKENFTGSFLEFERIEAE